MVTCRAENVGKDSLELVTACPAFRSLIFNMSFFMFVPFCFWFVPVLPRGNTSLSFYRVTCFVAVPPSVLLLVKAWV